MILKQNDKYIRSFVDAKTADEDQTTLIQFWASKDGKFDKNDLQQIFLTNEKQRTQLIAHLENSIDCLKESDFSDKEPEKIKVKKLVD